MSVRDVLEAGAAAGDLHLGGVWSSTARMAAGVAVHNTWQRAQMAANDAYEKEVVLAYRVVIRDWVVKITGRMDGLVREGDHLVIEEVKSSAFGGQRLSQLTHADMPRAIEQLRLYLHLIEKNGQDVVGRLVIVSLVDGTQRLLHVPHDPDVGPWMEARIEALLIRHEAHLAWQSRRHTATLPMPHDAWREGQASMADQVESAIHRGAHVLLAAPTGIGKTAAVLSGVLRVATATGKRVFFATSRTTQQRLVEDTLRAFADKGFPIHAVSIRARDKVCLNEVVACRPDCCRFARGHHDRVADGGLVSKLWREEAGLWTVPDPDSVVSLSQTHQVCPFALTMQLVGDADVVIGDYNYVFDPGRRLGAISESPDDWILIVDEAHNLPERAMGYASPGLERSLLVAALAALGPHPSYIACVDLLQDVLAFLDIGVVELDVDQEAYTLQDGLDARGINDLAARFDGLALDYAFLRHEQPVFEPTDDKWIEVARTVHAFRQTLERGGDETVVIWRREPTAGVRILCRDSSVLLGPVFDGLSASVAMSATLAPPEFYQAMLGVSAERTEQIQFESPFDPANRRVLVVPTVSTEYRHRARDKSAIATLISETVCAVPGNVAVFFSSFALRDTLVPELVLDGRPELLQRRQMNEAERAEVLNTMARGEGHVLLAVLGGIFSEGVDLPGAGLLATVVVGPALPPVGLERRLLSAWFEERYGAGFLYAYQVPGMARVVQAAGRVIRTPTDRGAIVLIGRRFLQRTYQAFFPEEWEATRANRPSEALAGHWPGMESVTDVVRAR
jgi:DNA excision repair protein ERCC-2